MSKISRVLVADDLVREDRTTPSPAVELALSIAERLGAELRLVHVYSLPDIPLAPEHLNLIEIPYVERMQDALDKEREALRAGHSNLNIVATVEKGGTTEVLLSSLDRYAADLVVLGTHTRREEGPGFVGTVAEEMIRRSRVPVVTVNPHSKIDFQALSRRTPNILAAIDFSPTTDALIDVAINLTRDLQGNLVLTHVVEEWAYPVIQGASLLAGGVILPLEKELRELANDRFVELTKLAEAAGRELGRAVSAKLIERAVSVSDGVQKAAEDAGAVIIIMAHRHTSRFQDIILGSNARAVLRQAKCAVLTLPPAVTEEFLRQTKKTA